MTKRQENEKSMLLSALTPESHEGKAGLFIVHDKAVIDALEAFLRLNMDALASQPQEYLRIEDAPVCSIEIPNPPPNLHALIDAFSEKWVLDQLPPKDDEK